MEYTVVIPAHNEAGNIGRLVEEIYEALADQPPHEVIVVDDRSTDGTGDEVRALIPTCPGLRLIRHARQGGQSAALRTGITATDAPVIVTLDGDGQNPPGDIPNLLAALGEPGGDGPALVNGVRRNRQGAANRRWASRFANGLRDWILDDGCPDTGCGLKAYWRELYLKLPYFDHMHRYIPALVKMYGEKAAYVDVGDRVRMAGSSKYTNFGRALVGIYDLIGIVWLRRRMSLPGVEFDSSRSASAPGQ